MSGYDRDEDRFPLGLANVFTLAVVLGVCAAVHQGDDLDSTAVQEESDAVYQAEQRAKADAKAEAQYAAYTQQNSASVSGDAVLVESSALTP